MMIIFQLHIKNERKKLHTKFTHSVGRFDNDTSELGTGDSVLVSSKKQKDNNHVKYAGDMLLNRKASFLKPVVQPSQKSLVNNVVFEKKFKLIVEKCLHTINDIR